MAAGQGPTGTHNSRESYQSATPPPAIVDTLHPDPGYTKAAVILGPRGSSSGVQVSAGLLWPDSYQRP